MSYAEKLLSFILSIFCLLVSLLYWYFCFGLVFAFGAGVPLFAHAVDWGFFQDGRSSYFLKKNKKYGKLSFSSYTDTVQNNIYDDNGNKVGSYETKGETHSGYTEDNREFLARYPLFIIYMLLFPIHRVLALFASFLSLFTNRFYVSVEAPTDYSHIKYYRSLHSLFNIVAERSVKRQNKIIEKQKEKERRKENLLKAKEEKKFENEQRKKEQYKTVDQYLGVFIKILGVIGVIIALYFILR